MATISWIENEKEVQKTTLIVKGIHTGDQVTKMLGVKSVV